MCYFKVSPLTVKRMDLTERYGSFSSRTHPLPPFSFTQYYTQCIATEHKIIQSFSLAERKRALRLPSQKILSNVAVVCCHSGTTRLWWLCIGSKMPKYMYSISGSSLTALYWQDVNSVNTWFYVSETLLTKTAQVLKNAMFCVNMLRWIYQNTVE